MKNALLVRTYKQVFLFIEFYHFPECYAIKKHGLAFLFILLQSFLYVQDTEFKQLFLQG